LYGIYSFGQNVTELLGLSPSYLFQLECLTRILNPEQGNVLRDHIEYDPDSASLNDGGPRVFLLSGFGELGSEDTDVDQDSPDIGARRRQWSCWIAAHRPNQPTWDEIDENNNPSGPRDLIVLEFELERDIYNPLTRTSQPAQTCEPDMRESSSETSLIREHEGLGTGTGDVSVNIGCPINTQGTPRRPTVPGRAKKMVDMAARVALGCSPTRRSTRFISAQSARFPPDAPLPMGLEGLNMEPSADEVLESTTNHARPIRALGRQGRRRQRFGHDIGNTPRLRASKERSDSRTPMRDLGMTDIVAVLAQINGQLGDAPDLETLFKVTIGIVQDLSSFHRVMIYQFDEDFNGRVVAELVEDGITTDLFKGLMFPAGDIPPQARELYRINKIRLLYDRGQATARMICKSRADLAHPLDMTHCYLRAMSPIHIKCEFTGPELALIRRSGEYESEVVDVDLDCGTWKALGSDRVPLLWSTWNEGFTPSQATYAHHF
jgi:hypothetical protein